MTEKKLPNTILEREFWLCPVQVFTGLTFAFVGFLIGLTVGLIH